MKILAPRSNIVRGTFDDVSHLKEPKNAKIFPCEERHCAIAILIIIICI